MRAPQQNTRRGVYNAATQIYLGDDITYYVYVAYNINAGEKIPFMLGCGSGGQNTVGSGRIRLSTKIGLMTLLDIKIRILKR